MKLDKISFDHYDKVGFRSIKDLITKADQLIRIEHIMNYHDNPAKAIGEVFVKSLDRVGRFTGVKKWIDSEGVQFFMEYVMNNHSYLTLGDVQVYCNEIIEGKYGQAYENISVQKLIMWFDEYEKSRGLKIHDAKKSMDAKSEKINLGDVDSNGFKRMADTYGKAFKKHLDREANKQPSYLSISEYIERNELEPDDFREKLTKEFDKNLEIILKERGGFTMETLPPQYYQSMFRNYKNAFLTEENQKLNPKH